MKKELITIIVPIYKVEKYLKRCIESILNQTYSNLEIILINDGSPDSCGNICDKYSEIDGRIKVIHKSNSGVSDSRNIGIEKSAGRYIAFVDADDYVDEKYIENLYRDLIKNNVDISAIGNIDIDEENNIIDKSKSVNKIINNKDALKEIFKEEVFQSVVWGKLYKKELFNNVRFNTDIKIAEDLELLYKILKNEIKISINTSDTLYFYTVRDNSATTKKYNKDWEKEIKLTKNIICDLQNTYPELISYAIMRYVRINTTCIIKLLKYEYDNKYEYEKLRNNIMEYIKQYLKNKEVNANKKIKTILVVYFKWFFKMIKL